MGGSSPGGTACPELAFSHQNPQVPNLERGGKIFPTNNSNYCCCRQALAKSFAGVSPLDLHASLSAVGIGSPTLQMRKLRPMKAE